jgi:nucleoside-diphosphate-sugar epimerase
MATVLVTGGSGYIASYCILALVRAGHGVRATVRNLDRGLDVRAMLVRGGLSVEQADDIEFFAANLESDAGWREAIEGCEYVLHVASPTLTSLPKSDEEMVRPAREGALRILRAAREAKVKRVVLTSAFGAVGYGHKPQTHAFTEEDWTEINDSVAPYQKSKTLAERAAWDFIRNEGQGLELAAINPVGVLGPALGPDYSPSLSLIQQMVDGAMPFAPKFGHGFVDVRDVADLHVKAMTRPEANGERFLAIAGHSLYVIDIARILQRRLGDRAGKLPRWNLPIWLTRLLAKRNVRLRAILPQLGRNLDASSEKAKRMLGWEPRPLEETIVETAESLIGLRV